MRSGRRGFRVGLSRGRRLSAFLVPFLALACGACGGTDGDEDRAPQELQRWTLSEEPLVRIGVADGPSHFLFERVREALFLPGGRILVADNGAQSLRIYDREGGFVRSMAGPGEGPGEIGSIGGLFLSDDAIVLYDRSNARITWFDLDGELRRSTRVGTGGLPERMFGPLEDGSLVFAETVRGVAVAGMRGISVDTMQIIRVDREGNDLGTFGEVRGIMRTEGFTHPFSTDPQGVTMGDRLYYANGEVPEVRVWAGDTQPLPALRLPPTAHETERVWRELGAVLEERDRDDLLARLSDMSERGPVPHLSTLLADDAGRLWIKQYEPSVDSSWLGGQRSRPGGSWWVTDGSGRLLGTVAVPSHVELLDVSGSQVLGVTTDQVGVQTVVVHALQDTSPGP